MEPDPRAVAALHKPLGSNTCLQRAKERRGGIFNESRKKDASLSSPTLLTHSPSNRLKTGHLPCADAMPTILNSALSLPPATRGLTLCLISCSTVYFFSRLSIARESLDFPADATGAKYRLPPPTGDAGTTVPWLNLVPANVAYAPWTLLTAAFVETNLVEVSLPCYSPILLVPLTTITAGGTTQFLVSLLTLPLAGRYLERVWGAQELVKFVIFTVVVSNAIAIVVSVVESIALGNKQLFLRVSLSLSSSLFSPKS